MNADLDKIQNNRLLLQAHDHDHEDGHHQHQPNPVILVDGQSNDNDHSHSHDHEDGHHHHHTHDPIVHSVFRKMGCLICFGFIFMMIVEKLSAHSH
eukprot:CAMPEP_0201586190 /NCGR_PEP_ID=MMETSP0190_2-20130828/130009_1 /ASSEMBLY_ACC=CAM_ASM_000263 /TAXON_ID=37353 /ORGANISM="Rosalina sp." /LENGTH=95 /DNA_ID=CAMNT_0048033675 /DNA_START=1 /DNA_END=285 /DNA_ORIENTATION=+